MDGLSKAQKDEMATAFAILALYDGGVSTCVIGIHYSFADAAARRAWRIRRKQTLKRAVFVA